jgi:biopolymer transport protein ExbD
MAKSRRQVLEINAGSMADIAFLLLIFFLVTTTMDQETGIQRRLPEKTDLPPPPDQIKRRNIFVVLVNRNDDLLVNDQPGDINILREKIKEFILNPQELETLSEYTETQIEGLGVYRVSKGIVSLQNDRLTSYEMYLTVQDELTRAFNELRNDLARQKFDKTYEELQVIAKVDPDNWGSKEKAIRQAIPISISEASPKDTKKALVQ